MSERISNNVSALVVRVNEVGAALDLLALEDQACSATTKGFEIELQFVTVDLGPLLLGVFAEHLRKRVMEQMRGRGRADALSPRNRPGPSPPREAATSLSQVSFMEDQATVDLRVSHLESHSGAEKLPLVAHLAAHLSVERRPVQHHRDRLVTGFAAPSTPRAPSAARTLSTSSLAAMMPTTWASDTSDVS